MHPLIRNRVIRKRITTKDYCQSLIGTMVWALGGTVYGIIRKAWREGRRIRIQIEAGEGRDLEAWADECSDWQHAANTMRMAKTVGKEVTNG